MQAQRIAYKGYQIQPITTAEDVGRYYGAYEISKDGRVVSARSNIFPGFFYRDAAVADSIEHAKLEIDNLASVVRKPGT
jgi:hypothetical protein